MLSLRRPTLACRQAQERPNGTLAVEYAGARRVQLLLPQQSEPFATVAAEW